MSLFGFNRKKGKKRKGPATLDQIGDMLEQSLSGFQRLASSPRLSSAGMSPPPPQINPPKENTRHDDDKTPDPGPPASPVSSR